MEAKELRIPIKERDKIKCTANRMIECLITVGIIYDALSDEYPHVVDDREFIIVDVMTKQGRVGITVDYFRFHERPKKDP